mgnify:CR=1 FL=1
MSTIDKLKWVVGKRGGVAKANRFNVIFTPPTQSLINLSPSAIIGVLAGGQSAKSLISDPRDISLLCQGANIPGRQITTIDYQAEKQIVPIPYAVIDEDVTLKFLLTGDPGQVDLPRRTTSGLKEALLVLKNVEGIGMIYLDDKDVIRHKLVKKVIDAYKSIENRD